MSAWPHGDPAVVAHAVLAEPRFAQAPPARETSLLDAALRWIGDRLHDVLVWLGQFFAGHAASFEFFSVALVVVLIGSALLAIAVAVGLQVRRSPARSARGRDVARPPRPGSAAELHVAALTAGAAGDYRAAAALLVRAAARALDERGRLADDLARTPLETARVLRDDAYATFAESATLVLYSDTRADASAWSNLLDRATSILP